MPDSPLFQESLTEQVREKLVHRIQEGLLKPGVKISEEELSKEFCVSRTPVREALLHLQHDGLVVMLPRRGIYVAPHTLDDIEEIYMLLGVLESHAAQLSVELMTDQELKHMEELTNELDQAASNRDFRAYTKMDRRIHETFLKACGSLRLTATVKTLKQQLQDSPIQMLSLPGWIAQSNKEHRLILEAFKQRDKEAIGKIIKDHWQFKESRTEVLNKLIARATTQ